MKNQKTTLLQVARQLVLLYPPYDHFCALTNHYKTGTKKRQSSPDLALPWISQIISKKETQTCSGAFPETVNIGDALVPSDFIYI